MKPIKKVNSELAKKREQLAQLQKEIEELEQQLVQLENNEMISAIREASLPADDVLKLVKAVKKSKKEFADVCAAIMGHSVPKAAPNESEEMLNE